VPIGLAMNKGPKVGRPLKISAFAGYGGIFGLLLDARLLRNGRKGLNKAPKISFSKSLEVFSHYLSAGSSPFRSLHE
jgi:hypothetical protein